MDKLCFQLLDSFFIYYYRSYIEKETFFRLMNIRRSQ